MPYFTISFIHYLWHSGASFCFYYGLLLRLEKAKELLRFHLHDFCNLTFVLAFKFCLPSNGATPFQSIASVFFWWKSFLYLQKYTITATIRVSHERTLFHDVFTMFWKDHRVFFKILSWRYQDQSNHFSIDSILFCNLCIIQTDCITSTPGSCFQTILPCFNDTHYVVMGYTSLNKILFIPQNGMLDWFQARSDQSRILMENVAGFALAP